MRKQLYRSYITTTTAMSDLADNPLEPVSAHQLEKKSNGDAEKPAENRSNGGAEKPAENGAGDAVKEDKKENGSGERRERNGDEGGRKRRGSYNDDRRGGFDKRGRGGGRGRGGRGGNNNHRGGRNMNRSRFEQLPESDDQAEIRRQVEFYFSDSNLPVDAYLLKLTGAKDNKPVPLKTIHDFKRMRHFQPYSAVREAVANSEFLDLNDHDEITRKTPLADKFTDDVDENKSIAQTTSMARSAYVKGFPEETEKTQLDLEAFFAAYNVKAVRLRRQEDGYFKGSVFIEFESEEDQKTFLESEQKLEFGGKTLQVMSKQEYVDKKSQDIRDGKVKPRSPTRYGGQKHHSYDRKGDKDDWNKRRDRDNERDGRGRGRGRGGRGGRGGRRDDRDRSRSSSPNDRFGRSRRSEKDEDKKGDASELLDRAEAEAARDAKKSESEKVEDAAKAGAEAATAGESKKRAREDDGAADAEKGEAKKVKEDAGEAASETA